MNNIIDFQNYKEIKEQLNQNEQFEINKIIFTNTSNQSPTIPKVTIHPDCQCKTYQIGITTSRYE